MTLVSSGSFACSVVFLCWLRLDFVPLSVVLGAFDSLSLLSIHTIPSVCYPRPCRLQRLCMQSPNYEHVKFAAQWINAYPDAISYACPGLVDLHPEIPYTTSVGVQNQTPESWPSEV
jgi:hypothetical protein